MQFLEFPFVPDIYRIKFLDFGGFVLCCATQKFYKCLKVVSIPFFVDSCLNTLKEEKVGKLFLVQAKKVHKYIELPLFLWKRNFMKSAHFFKIVFVQQFYWLKLQLSIEIWDWNKWRLGEKLRKNQALYKFFTKHFQRISFCWKLTNCILWIKQWQFFLNFIPF